MRRLVVAICVPALLWCGWWALAANGLSSGVEDWLEQRRAEGWQAEVRETSTSGFPSRVSTVLSGLALADPASGLAVDLEDLGLSFRALWPGDIRVDLPRSPLRVATPEGRWLVLADPAQADLNLHPGPALELENLSLTSGPFRLEADDGLGVLGGEALRLALTQGDRATDYDLRFDVTDFAPGDGPRQVLLLPNTWPLIFDTLTASADITFDRPIDQRTLEDARPQPQAIDLTLIEAQWGDMRLLATGQLRRDAVGYAEGALTIKAENWQRMLDLAAATGLLPPEMRPRIEFVLRGLASSTGSTNDLDVTLDFEGGRTRLGFIPLGPAPSMILR